MRISITPCRWHLAKHVAGNDTPHTPTRLTHGVLHRFSGLCTPYVYRPLIQKKNKKKNAPAVVCARQTRCSEHKMLSVLLNCFIPGWILSDMKLITSQRLTSFWRSRQNVRLYLIFYFVYTCAIQALQDFFFNAGNSKLRTVLDSDNEGLLPRIRGCVFILLGRRRACE